MHCATFFNLIYMNKTLDVFSGFTDNVIKLVILFFKNEKNMIKRLIITSVLATDMSKHNKLVAKFGKRVDATIKSKELKRRGEEIDELTNYLYLNSENPEDRRVKNLKFNLLVCFKYMCSCL